MMPAVFHFFLRFFWAFLLSWLVLRGTGGGPAAWLGLTLVFVAISYLIRPLVRLYRRYGRPRVQLWSWRWARFCIGLNRLRRRP